MSNDTEGSGVIAAGGAFLEVADRIGCRLCRDAVWAGEQCNWLGWSMDFRNGQWAPAYRAMGALLYDGTAGIGLFLARLASLTGDRVARITARGALAQALSAAGKLGDAGEFGYYSGLAGIAHCCMAAAPLLNDPGLADLGAHTLSRAASIAPHPQRLDVINGSAGLIPLLLTASTGPQRDAHMAAAIQHGEQLLALAEHSAEGWSWNTIGTKGPRNLVGYSHGTAGIACALGELARATSREDFLEAAREALRYESSHYRPTQGNWPDFREFTATDPQVEPPCMLAWCHGAPGIGIGRLRMLDVLDEPGLFADIEIAISSTAASLALPVSEHGGNFSLCHGHAGNADLLVLAADRLRRPELRQRAEAVAAAAACFEQQCLPWPCGVPCAGETPNLMLGVAGIGYFFLRLHDSQVIPSVLSVGLATW